MFFRKHIFLFCFICNIFLKRSESMCRNEFRGIAKISRNRLSLIVARRLQRIYFCINKKKPSKEKEASSTPNFITKKWYVLK